MMGGELFENLLYPLTDWYSLPHKMTGMLKAELNTNLLLLNNQQLSALYFISRGRRHPPDPRPSCPYLARVSVVVASVLWSASLHILLPVIRMLSAQPSAYSLQLTASSPACSQSQPCPHSFLLFWKLPRRFHSPQSAASDHAAVLCAAW